MAERYSGGTVALETGWVAEVGNRILPCLAQPGAPNTFASALNNPFPETSVLMQPERWLRYNPRKIAGTAIKLDEAISNMVLARSTNTLSTTPLNEKRRVK